MHSRFVSAILAVEHCYNSGEVNIMRRFRIRITAGAHTGRFIGPNIEGLITNQELLKDREVRLPGTKYSLYAQERGATQFFENVAPDVQAELKKLGYETETIEVS